MGLQPRPSSELERSGAGADLVHGGRVWEATFVNAPSSFPLLRVVGRAENANGTADDSRSDLHTNVDAPHLNNSGPAWYPFEVAAAPVTVSVTRMSRAMDAVSDGASFTLAFRGATTAPIDASATADELEAALEALPTVGDVRVSRVANDAAAGFTDNTGFEIGRAHV